MKSLILIGGVLLACVNVNSAAAEDDLAAVRKCSERYTALVQKADRAALDDILDTRYQGINLTGDRPSSSEDKSESIRHWVWLHSFNSLVKLEDKIESIRIFEHTAIEIGVRNAIGKDTSIWRDMRYTRVWVKDGQDWRLANEQY